MIQKTIFYLRFGILFIFSLIMNSCSSDDGTISCFPNSTINSTINLALPQYQNLLNPGGFVETFGATGEGTRGLIIYRKSLTEFKVYDRNAPHLCPSEDTTLYVKNQLTIDCPKDGANWNINTGEPINGISRSSPRVYFANFNPSTNIIYITN